MIEKSFYMMVGAFFAVIGCTTISMHRTVTEIKKDYNELEQMIDNILNVSK